MNWKSKISKEKRPKMILPDINLLIYAHNIRAAHHSKALRWWNHCLQGPQGVALAWAVILGFVRIATHPKVFEHPLLVEDALQRIEEWLSLPHVFLLHPPQTHFATWSSLLKGIGIA